MLLAGSLGLMLLRSSVSISTSINQHFLLKIVLGKSMRFGICYDFRLVCCVPLRLLELGSPDWDGGAQPFFINNYFFLKLGLQKCIFICICEFYWLVWYAPLRLLTGLSRLRWSCTWALGSQPLESRFNLRSCAQPAQACTSPFLRCCSFFFYNSRWEGAFLILGGDRVEHNLIKERSPAEKNISEGDR